MQARNREVTEALEQQTATGAILRVIAASPTDIQPVLQVVAESAARFCDTHDAVILLPQDGDARHQGALRPDPAGLRAQYCRSRATGSPAAPSSTARRCMFTTCSRPATNFRSANPWPMQPGHRTIAATPLMRSGEAIGRLGHPAHRGPAVQRQADRAAADLRRPGGHRHRERAAVRGGAGAQPRADRIAGAADRDQRHSQRHLAARRPICSRFST